MKKTKGKPVKDRWVKRRRIIYVVVTWGLLSTSYLMSPWAESDPLRIAIANGILLLLGSVILGYTGVAAWDDRNMKSIVEEIEITEEG